MGLAEPVRASMSRRRHDVVSRSVSGPTCGRRRLVPSRGVLCSCQPTGDGTWWARPPGDLHALLEFVPQGLDGIIIDDARYDAAFAYSEALAASADRFDLFFWGLPPQFLFGVASSSS